MRTFTLTLLAIAMTAILAGCGSNATDGLVDTDWQLTAMTEQTPAFQAVVPPEDQGKYTIRFADGGTFAGTADCNAVAGTYTTRGSDEMTITVGSSTLALCPEGSMGGLFVHALSNVTNFAIADGELTLKLQGGGTLGFVAGTGAPVPSASASTAVVATPAPTPTASPTPSPRRPPARAPRPGRAPPRPRSRRPARPPSRPRSRRGAHRQADPGADTQAHPDPRARARTSSARTGSSPRSRR